MTCPRCSKEPESYFANGRACPMCGRRESLFLKAFGVPEPTKQEEDEFAIHTLSLQLADMTERCEAHKANYEYMAKRCEEQQKEIESLRAKAVEPLFWYRPCRDGLYEGPIFHNSVGGKMLRDEKPLEWKPLYSVPPETVAQIEREQVMLKLRTTHVLAVLESIANADTSKWEPDMRDQFQQWAQNRARHTLEKVGAGGTAPLPANRY